MIEYGLFRYHDNGTQSKIIIAKNLTDQLNRWDAISDKTAWRTVRRNVTEWEIE